MRQPLSFIGWCREPLGFSRIEWKQPDWLEWNADLYTLYTCTHPLALSVIFVCFRLSSERPFCIGTDNDCYIYSVSYRYFSRREPQFIVSHAWCSWLSHSPHTRKVPGSNPGECIFYTIKSTTLNCYKPSNKFNIIIISQNTIYTLISQESHHVWPNIQIHSSFMA